MSKLQRSILLTSAAFSLLTPVGVRAADTVVAVGQAEVEQVVVTARRREERLQDVPISISVFNQKQLQNHNVVNAQDLAAYTPSLQADSDFGSQNSSFAIRGFAQDIGTAPSVGVFFDDVVAPRGLSQGIQGGDGAGPGDFFDLQNVQVLKGPQGTLFGRNTTGGDILLVPQKPSGDFGGYVQGSFGNYNMKGGQGVINIPVNDDIRLRFGIDHQSRDGFVINTDGIGPKDFRDVNYTALRGSVDIDVTPDLEDYLVASYANSDTHGDFQKLIACNTNPKSRTPTPFLPGGCEQLGLSGASQDFTTIALSAANSQGSGFYDGAQVLPSAYSKLSTWRLINTTTWRASDNLTVKNIASYAQLNQKIANPLFGTDLRTFNSLLPNNPQLPFQFAAVTTIPGGSFQDQATYTEELQFQGNYWDSRLTWQAGAYMEGSVPLSVVGAQSGVVADCPNVAAFQCSDSVGANLEALSPNTHVATINYTAGTTNTNDYALYTQETFKITDYLKLTGGFRYSWDRESNTGNRITYNPNYSYDPTTLKTLPFSIVNANCTDVVAPGYVKSIGSAGVPGYGTTPIPNGACVDTTTENSNAPTWLLDLDFTPTDDILVYAKWARGYRQGVTAPNVPPPLNITGPEKVDDYELGVKTSFDFDGIAGTFDIDGFYNDFRNQQILLGLNAAQGCGQSASAPPCLSPTSAPFNAGKSRIDGLELDSEIIPYEGVTLTVGYTYLDTSILAARTPPPDPLFFVPLGGFASKGDSLLLAPKNKATITAAYLLPLDDSIGKITVSTTFTHTDSMVTNYIDRTAGFPNLDRVQPTDLLDFNLNWDQVLGKPVDLSLFATNVTGDKYYTWIPGLLASTGLETASVGAPTFYGARITIHFGDE